MLFNGSQANKSLKLGQCRVLAGEEKKTDQVAQAQLVCAPEGNKPTCQWKDVSRRSLWLSSGRAELAGHAWGTWVRQVPAGGVGSLHRRGP